VVEVGPGARNKDGAIIPPSVKKGDRVLLPEYGGSPVKLGEAEFVLYRNDDLLGLIENK
jgi:chaperonin GroES